MKRSLEKNILLHGVSVAIAYQLYQVLMSFFPVYKLEMALINMFIVLVLFYLYLLIHRKGALPALILFLHVIAISGFTFFYKNYGGLAGTVPSFLCVYTAFILVCSGGVFRGLLIATLIGVLTIFIFFPQVLGMESVREPIKIGTYQRGVDYLIVAVIIVIFLLYMKKQFLFYRKSVEHRYEQLDQIAQTLHIQNQELATRQEETRAINENLESLVEERTHELENKNKELSEYAFINAHMLRGPLCRIIGLINLMEKEPEMYPAAQLAHLKETAQEIDKRVKEIDTVIS